ncbi:MAG: RNA-binding domain-containing protein [bacterium]
MKTTADEFTKLISTKREHEQLEFKEAKDQFSFDNGTHSLLGYIVAISNAKGGKLILGVTDKYPRKVIGSNAFINLADIENKVFERLKIKVTADEIYLDNKRLVIFHIPSRQIGEPLMFEGKHLIRHNDQIVALSNYELKKIFNESITDYSSLIHPNASFDDLDPKAINVLRKLLIKAKRIERPIGNLTDEQVLSDLGLITAEGITNAAIVLLACERSISNLLPFAEIRYGFRLDESEMQNQDTVIFKQGYLLFHDAIWEKVDSRNLTLNIYIGMVINERKAFVEEAIREAINNAVIHRDYMDNRSIIIIQTNRDITFKSPGGLLEGITIENMIDKTKARNQLIATVLHKCGLVETFGNGVNLMYRKQIELGKEAPDYSKTDSDEVVLVLNGQIENMRFTKYILAVSEDYNIILDDEELRILVLLQDEPKKLLLRDFKRLLNIGIVEKTNDRKIMLSKQYYEYSGLLGEYTADKGLDKDTNLELIIKHLENNKKGYMNEFKQILKDKSKSTINKYLSELRAKGIIKLVGNPKKSVGQDSPFWILCDDSGDN